MPITKEIACLGEKTVDYYFNKIIYCFIRNGNNTFWIKQKLPVLTYFTYGKININFLVKSNHIMQIDFHTIIYSIYYRTIFCRKWYNTFCIESSHIIRI